MANARGAAPKLRSEQIQRVLHWDAHRRAFKATHGTLAALAQRLRVSVAVVRGCPARGDILRDSRAGRSQMLSAVQMSQILAWREAHAAFRDSVPTLSKLARELGVCVNTVRSCVRRQGSYQKQQPTVDPDRALRAAPARRATKASQIVAWRRDWLQAWPRARAAGEAPPNDALSGDDHGAAADSHDIDPDEDDEEAV